MSQTPQTASDDPMAGVRRDIDRIDRDLVALLALRAGCIDRAIAIKARAGLPARIEPRIDEVLAAVRNAAAAQNLDPTLVEDLWRRLIDWSIAREAAVLGGETGPA